MYGLLERDVYYIKYALRAFPEIEKAILFGSRALGNYKQGSDVDIALVGKKVDSHIINKLSARLNEELPIPYHVDVLNYATISNQKLKEHIVQYGIEMYRKQDNLKNEFSKK